MSDLTVKILEQIRDDMRGMRGDLREEIGTLRQELVAGFAGSNARFEVIETALRDLAQQLVILGRGVKVAIEARAANDAKIDDHERRIAELERKLG